MHVMTVAYVMGSFQNFLYGDRKEDAEAGFKKINDAMQEWRRFKNDASETVTLDDIGGVTVFRIEHLASVSLSDMTASESEQADWYAYTGRLNGVSKNAEKGVAQSPQDTAHD